MNIEVDPGDANPAADALNGVYEKHRQMQPGDHILDLGAHRGYFSMVAHEKIGPTGQIVAFEPHPGNFKRLVERCQFPNILCVNAGAWDRDSRANLWPAIDNSGGHSFFKVPAGQEAEPIECDLVDIGKWLMRHKFVPTFVKIDTELAEMNIIHSLMETPLRPEIAAEIHNRAMWDACCGMLKAAGYNLTPDSFTNYYLYAWQ